MRVHLNDLSRGQLPATILKDPYAELYRNKNTVEAENIYSEVEGHIRHQLAAAQSAKRNAVYEAISDSPIILGTLMLDPASIVAMLKTTPVFYEFYRGHDEAMNFARNLVRAKKIDQHFREQNGYSDARIFHVVGLELQTDPEMLNRKIDHDREKLIEQSISRSRPIHATLHDFFEKQKKNARFGLKLVKRSPKKSAYFFFKTLRNSAYKIKNGIQEISYKKAFGNFLRASLQDVAKLFPSLSKLKQDALSVKKSDIQQGKILSILECFHASHFGIIGTYTASTVIEAHQLLDYAIVTPIHGVYSKYFKAASALPEQTSNDPLLEQATHSNAVMAGGATSLFMNANDNTPPLKTSDMHLKVQPVHTESPVNIHKLDREYQRILRNRKKDIKSSAFNSAAKAGETYFVYDLGKMTIEAFQNAAQASDYTVGSFYLLTTVLSVAVTNHICTRRIEIFNRLQSERSKMARKNAQRVSLENNIRIVKEALEKLGNDKDAKNNSFTDTDIKDITNILSRLVKIEKRSFDIETRESIRDFLNDLMEFTLVITHDKDEQEIKDLVSKVHPSYFQKPLIIKKTDEQNSSPNAPSN
ncbi:MAG: hypothetical protein ACK4VI_02260 [Alphaproteobacteria bacterium]